MGTPERLAAWTGRGRLTLAVVALWRVAGVLAAWLVVRAPVMTVGRRPYEVSRLIDRLEAIRDMAITPPWLPTALRWFSAAAMVTAVTGVVAPAAWRRLHGVLPLATLVLALVVHRAATNASFTSPTRELTVAAVAAGVAGLAALAPGTRRPYEGG